MYTIVAFAFITPSECANAMLFGIVNMPRIGTCVILDVQHASSHAKAESLNLIGTVLICILGTTRVD